MEEKLNVKQINMTDHAYRRAQERFNMPDRKHALGHFRGLLQLAKRVGHIVAEDGAEAVLYAHGRTAVYLSPDLTTIKTVMRHEEVSYHPIKNKIELIHRKELNKLERIEKSKIRILEDQKLKYAIELAELNYRQRKTRSNNVRVYCENKKQEINSFLADLEKQLEDIRNNKRQVARSMVSVL